MRQIPYTPALLDATSAEAKNAATHRGGQRFDYFGLSAATPTTKLAYIQQNLNLLFERMFAQMNLSVEHISGLTVGVCDGVYRKADGTEVSFAGSTGFAITASVTAQKLYILVSSNALTQAASWPADKTTFMPLAEIDTDGSAVTEIRDRRWLVRDWIPASSTDISSTNATSFVTDLDNAGAGVDGGYRHNRGTSGGGEDAMLKWVEASEAWRALARDSAGTRAALDALKLLIGGTEVIDTAATLLAAALSSTRMYFFGANGATAAGLGILQGSVPASGAHAAGELCFTTAGVYICTIDGTPGTWKNVADFITTLPSDIVAPGKLSSALRGSLSQAILSDNTGASPLTLTLQMKDAAGTNLTGVQYIIVGVYQDADGAATATTATIDNTPLAGTFVRWITSNKVAVYKTDSNGLLQLDVTMPSAETIYALAEATARSARVDCSDIATLTRT